MTEVDFHFNVPDKLIYACRFLRKAIHRGVPVVVTAPTDVLKQLDVLLWTFSVHEFVPHALATDEAHVKSASPVLLCESATEASHRHKRTHAQLGHLFGPQHFARNLGQTRE